MNEAKAVYILNNCFLVCHYVVNDAEVSIVVKCFCYQLLSWERKEKRDKG